jgi:hypothetical protein
MEALKYRLYTAGACAFGVVAVAASLSAIELWSNLYHDPFHPNVQGHAWTIFTFNIYGALFISGVGYLAYLVALTLLKGQTAAPTRRGVLTSALCRAVLYLLMHHSRHILWYWEPGGTW